MATGIAKMHKKHRNNNMATVTQNGAVISINAEIPINSKKFMIYIFVSLLRIFDI